MNIADWTGSTGVLLILLAFFLNMFNRLSKDGATYILMNIIGAGLACTASVMIGYLPFIILEAAWTAVSVAALIRLFILSKS